VELDNAALQTLKLAAPFDPFPPDLARQHRVLRFVYEWRYTGGGGISAIP
jgi:outer membrane biosynthesis protein TonB